MASVQLVYVIGTGEYNHGSMTVDGVELHPGASWCWRKLYGTFQVERRFEHIKRSYHRAGALGFPTEEFSIAVVLDVDDRLDSKSQSIFTRAKHFFSSRSDDFVVPISLYA